MWSSERVIPRTTPDVYEVDTYSTISTKIDSLYHKVESISQAAQTKKSNCEECGVEHKTSECPILMQGIEQVETPRNLPSNTEINPKEQAKAITTRSRVQLPEIHVKRPGVIGETSFPTEEETVVKESTPKENSDKSQDRAKMPSYAKFLKDIISNKRKLEDHETVMLTEECTLCDLGTSINLMPLSIFRKLGLGEPKATTVTLQLADRSLTHPRGIIEDVLVKVDKLIFLADFLILNMEEDKDVPIILG
ncbi:uncharacterized protein LOC111382772 [Olea europaea var. sylvestris]|uniref:uncharacterized protein LOC111382772 n=1 Tax=Olea europaea var. sylvestris TaxID=158386 RepID=UPI000C1D336C|nr:uncharacterized protein LOC111382772 [Olea europaea var. sylvestris]